MPAELAKRIICACIREICFLEILWGSKDKIFLGHFWLGVFTQDNLHNTSRQPGGNTGCLKKLLYIIVLPFSFVFSGCLTRHVINAARTVLFKSTIKLNNFSSDKKHNLNWQVDV